MSDVEPVVLYALLTHFGICVTFHTLVSLASKVMAFHISFVKVKAIFAHIATVDARSAAVSALVYLASNIFAETGISVEFETIYANVTALDPRDSARIAVIKKALGTFASAEQCIVVVAFRALVTGVNASLIASLAMLEAASRVFTNSLELVEEISSVALITAIFTRISAVYAIVEGALLADTAILHGLVVKALDLVHEEEGDEKPGQDNCKPYKRALHVLNSEALTSLLLAVAADTLEPMLLKLVNFDHLVDKHEEFKDELSEQKQLTTDSECLN